MVSTALPWRPALLAAVVPSPVAPAARGVGGGADLVRPVQVCAVAAAPRERRRGAHPRRALVNVYINAPGAVPSSGTASSKAGTTCAGPAAALPPSSHRRYVSMVRLIHSGWSLFRGRGIKVDLYLFINCFYSRALVQMYTRTRVLLSRNASTFLLPTVIKSEVRRNHTF